MASIEEIIARFDPSPGVWAQIACDEGWYPLLKNLDDKLVDLYPDVQYFQIKEKFGGLRVYLSGVPEDAETFRQVNSAIDSAERESFKTCEVCGKAGVARQGSWIRTLCDKDSKGRLPLEEDE